MPAPPIPGLPAPPAPGAPTQTYGYPVFGPKDYQYAGVPDEASASTGLAGGETFLRYLNPFRWFGKQISYMNETRWFNTFRSEPAKSYDRESKEHVATGRTENRHSNGMCWTVEEVTVRSWVEPAYHEVQRYETWTINLTQESYFEFFTGMGGTAIDVAIDAPAAALAGASEALGASAATATAAAAEASTLGATAGGFGVGGGPR